MAPAAQKTLVGDLPPAAASPQVYGHTHPSQRYQSPFQTVDLRGRPGSTPISIARFISVQLLSPSEQLRARPAPRALPVLAYLAAFLGLVLLLRGAAALLRRRRLPVGRGLHGGGEEVAGKGHDEKRDRDGWLLGGCDRDGLDAGVYRGGAGAESRSEPEEVDSVDDGDGDGYGSRAYLPGHLRMYGCRPWER